MKAEARDSEEWGLLTSEAQEVVNREKGLERGRSSKEGGSLISRASCFGDSSGVQFVSK